MAETESPKCCPGSEETSLRHRPPNHIHTWKFLLILALILVISTSALVISNKLLPKQFITFSIEEASMSHYNLTEYEDNNNITFNAAFKINFVFSNTDTQVSMECFEVELRIERDNQTLAITHDFEGFELSPRKEQRLHGNLVCENVTIENPTDQDLVPTPVLREVKFDIRIKISIQLDRQGSDGEEAEILCKSVKVHDPAQTKASKKKQCYRYL